jgi:aspartate aminotransferase
MVRLADGEPVIVRAGVEAGFKITPEQLEAAITAKTRLFVINSPSNPTGVAYTRAELAALGAALKRHPQLIIATDDMYEHILWSKEPFSNILGPCPELYDRTMVLNGVSKVYAMTGWRIGYAGGPAELVKAMKKVQSQSTSNPTSISQVAAQAALEGDQACIQPMVKAFRERHDFVVDALNNIPGITCLPADGTFYCFPFVQPAIDRLEGIADDIELAEFLLDKAGVALVPGSAFGAPGYIRLSFATGLDTLKDALARLAGALTG